jgi:hypothetical protein
LFHARKKRKPSIAGGLLRFAACQDWLPESDALQNGKGLLFEFSFGQLNTAKGKKRLLPREAFAEAAHEKIARPNTRALVDQILFARECRQKLLDFPALTRKDIAKQLGVTTARLNQIIRKWADRKAP